MPQLSLTSEQVMDLVNQLPAQEKRALLLTLASAAATRREQRMAHAENQLRQRAAERGLCWDDLNEDEREAFVDDLLHEK